VCLHAPALVHWGVDGWQHPADVCTEPLSLGLHVARLPTATLQGGQRIDFAWCWQASGEWAGAQGRVTFDSATPAKAGGPSGARGSLPGP